MSIKIESFVNEANPSKPLADQTKEDEVLDYSNLDKNELIKTLEVFDRDNFKQ